MTTLLPIAVNPIDGRKTTDHAHGDREDRSRPSAPMPDRKGAGFVPPVDDAQAIERRLREWRETYNPSPGEQEWLFGQVVVNSLRVDHCRRLESELRAYEARRALLSWDDDRRLDAEATAASLSRRPALVVRRLRKTTQGCDWLIDRWQALGRAFEASGEWSPKQRGLALDLLGTPADLREGVTWESPPDLVGREVARLQRLQAEALDELDAAEREAAVVGLELAPSPDLLRLRRYEADCLRRYHRFRDRLTRLRRAGQPVAVEPASVPAASPALSPTDAAERCRQALASPSTPAPPCPPASCEPPAEPEPPVQSPLPRVAPRPPQVIHTMIPASPRFSNRKMRRAAEKMAAASR